MRMHPGRPDLDAIFLRLDARTAVRRQIGLQGVSWVKIGNVSGWFSEHGRGFAKRG